MKEFIKEIQKEYNEAMEYFKDKLTDYDMGRSAIIAHIAEEYGVNYYQIEKMLEVKEEGEQ